MSQQEGPSREANAGPPAGGAMPRRRYRTARARLARPPRPSPPAPPRWLDELTAFNDELRRLFVKPASRARTLSGDRICDAVAAHYRLSVAELIGGCLSRRCVRPRHVAMYICARQAGLSSTRIARMFGDRDPSTVLVAMRTLETRIARDPALAAEVRALIEQCRAGAPA